MQHIASAARLVQQCILGLVVKDSRLSYEGPLREREEEEERKKVVEQSEELDLVKWSVYLLLGQHEKYMRPPHGGKGSSYSKLPVCMRVCMRV